MCGYKFGDFGLTRVRHIYKKSGGPKKRRRFTTTSWYAKKASYGKILTENLVVERTVTQYLEGLRTKETGKGVKGTSLGITVGRVNVMRGHGVVFVN